MSDEIDDAVHVNRDDEGVWLHIDSTQTLTDEQAISLAVALIQATQGSVAAESNGTTLKVPFAFSLAAGLSVVQREHALEAGLALIRAAVNKETK